MDLNSQNYAKFLLSVFAVAIVLISSHSLLLRFVVALRLRAVGKQESRPARTSFWYTAISICRECSYGQLHVPIVGRLPANGVLCVCASYMVVMLCCLLINLHLSRSILWETVAMRAAYLSLAQLVMLMVLPIKINILGYCLGTSSERLLVYHRMLGCGTLVTVTMHMTFFMREWLYYGVWDSQWSEMGAGMLRWGYAAWGLLLIIVVTSINPFRNRWFDHWILIHVFTMLAFFAMTVLHVNASCRLWTISPLVIWAIDSVLRIVSRLRRNTKFGRISTVKYSAILQSLPGEVTRITISNCVIKHHAGQYIYLTVHKLGIHSHAVTIASARDAADLVLFMKAKHGFTRRLLNCSSSALLPYAIGLPCSIEGPYGGSHTPMQAFDTVVLIAGGVGASFTTSLLQDLVNNPGCCRTIRFTWTIKAQSHACWYSDILIQCLRIASTRNIILKIDVHVTSETYPIEDRSSRSRLSVQGKPAEQDNSVCINSVAEIHSISRSPVLVTTDPRTERVKSVLTDIRYYCGRPDFHKLISSTVQSAQGESGIATCGPASMATSIRNHVVDISDARAVKKGTEAEAIYLHVEGQA